MTEVNLEIWVAFDEDGDLVAGMHDGAKDAAQDYVDQYSMAPDAVIKLNVTATIPDAPEFSVTVAAERVTGVEVEAEAPDTDPTEGQ
ncbi:MAG: hypothetical protein ACR2PR_08825 [Pseudohongiellaceae bacterium]